MVWIWQHQDWPNFRFDEKELVGFEGEFLQKAGMLYGAMRHVEEGDRNALTIQLMSEEALKTSEIEGDILDRESVQSSIQRQLGLNTPKKKISPAEQGISEMMVDVYHTYSGQLFHETLFGWHRMLTSCRRDLRDIGCYRTHNEPVQIVSSSLHEPKIHYEAPPSKAVKREMTAFLSWFNKASKEGKLGALARSGIAHLYFESIYPIGSDDIQFIFKNRHSTNSTTKTSFLTDFSLY